MGGASRLKCPVFGGVCLELVFEGVCPEGMFTSHEGGM